MKGNTSGTHRSTYDVFCNWDETEQTLSGNGSITGNKSGIVSTLQQLNHELSEYDYIVGTEHRWAITSKRRVGFFWLDTKALIEIETN